MTLQEFFQENPRVALGFSGGVDSSYLLYAALQAGADVRPYYISTVFQPAFEREDAMRLAADLGVEVTVVPYDILSHPEVASNPSDRCYHCKTALFGALRDRAAADGYTVLIDGTNASDEAGDRPGMRALAEMSVRSPSGNAALPKPMCGVCPAKQGCSPGTSPPTPACPPASRPVGRSKPDCWPVWKSRKPRCLRWVFPTSAFGCTARRRASSSAPLTSQALSNAGRKSWPGCSPILKPYCWTSSHDDSVW